MSKILWLQACRGAWVSYVKKMNKRMKPRNMESYLSQEIEMGMKLEEFAEIIFMEGFAAGEKYSKSCIIGVRKCEPNLN